MLNMYISGPMSGIEDCNRAVFRFWSEFLRELGYNPLNPAELEPGHDYEWYIEVDLTTIAIAADALLMLVNWEQSPGAVREHALAVSLGLPVIYT
jgi:hypothetical protein